MTLRGGPAIFIAGPPHYLAVTDLIQTKEKVLTETAKDQRQSDAVVVKIRNHQTVGFFGQQLTYSELVEYIGENSATIQWENFGPAPRFKSIRS